MAKQEESEKTYYKLGQNANVFYDKTQAPPNKIVGSQVIELLETEAVANAVTYKHIVPAKKNEIDAYQKEQDAKAAAAAEKPLVSLDEVQKAASRVVADAETHAQTIKQEAEEHLTTKQAEADKLVAKAQAEADKIVDQATKDASKLTGSAKLEADKIIKDAKAEAAKAGGGK